MGKVAHGKENYKRAVEWQILALKQINEENDSTISKVEVMSQLANSNFKVFSAVKYYLSFHNRIMIVLIAR